MEDCLEINKYKWFKGEIKMNQEPIFIIGPHKSGTSLLRNLFDGHKDLFVIPIESHFFQHLGFWIDYGIRTQKPKDYNNQEIEKNYINWIKKSNTIPGGKSDSDTRGFWNLEKFKILLKENINDIRKKNFKSLIELYIESMFYSLYNKNIPENKRIVEKSVDHAEFAIYLKKLFPKAKFIHIIRNPYSNLVSLRKFKSENGYPFMKSLMESFYNNYYYLYMNKRVIETDYYIIKYEDLINNPKQSIDKISDFLNIEKHEILYKPTVNGNLWEGNSTTNKRFKGISNSHLNKWKEEIYPLEINLINKNFKFILEKYNYEYIPYRNSFFPNKKESFKHYFANRIFYKFFTKWKR